MVAGALTGIPAAQRDTVRSALSDILGRRPIDRIVPLSGGVSAGAVLRIDAGAHRYVVRVEGPRSPLRYPGQYQAMRIVAEAGIAPGILFLDEVQGIVVMEGVDERPLRSCPGGLPALARGVGELMARLHAAPLFPSFLSYPDIVTRLFSHVRQTGLFSPGMLDDHAERLERLKADYGWDTASSVSCHNDLYPRNILFDGERLWLIDWESAYPNDPLVDVAILLDNVATTPVLEDILLRARFGSLPDASLRKRLGQVRALVRLYYAGVCLSAVATVERAAPESDLSAPSLAQFERSLQEGRLAHGAIETKLVMGKMFLRGFLGGDAVPPLSDL